MQTTRSEYLTKMLNSFLEPLSAYLQNHPNDPALEKISKIFLAVWGRYHHKLSIDEISEWADQVYETLCDSADLDAEYDDFNQYINEFRQLLNINQ